MSSATPFMYTLLYITFSRASLSVFDCPFLPFKKVFVSFISVQ